MDRQPRLTAQSLLIEANLLRAQGAKTAQQVIEKMQQARPLLLSEIGEPLWMTISLWLTGQAYGALSQPAKAIEYYEQALPLSRELKDRRGESTALIGIGGVCVRAQPGREDGGIL
ncbi:MAG: tetratricopeptide repeat protein [Acidobacteria bacterium]|nr:tetratricopeptide repeat protein [Acidobacteriota bacterium]